MVDIVDNNDIFLVKVFDNPISCLVKSGGRREKIKSRDKIDKRNKSDKIKYFFKFSWILTSNATVLIN